MSARTYHSALGELEEVGCLHDCGDGDSDSDSEGEVRLFVCGEEK
jgi:hypothetical protein